MATHPSEHDVDDDVSLSPLALSSVRLLPLYSFPFHQQLHHPIFSIPIPSLFLFFLWGVGSRSRAGERPAVNHWRHRWGGGAPSRATHTRTHTHRQFYPIREMAILFPISRPSHWATNVIVSICHSAMIIRYTRPISFLFHCHWSDPTATVWNENQSFDPLSRQPSFLRRVHQTGPLMPPAYWAFIFFFVSVVDFYDVQKEKDSFHRLSFIIERAPARSSSLSLYTCLYFPSAAVSN